jgi:hypothetical protein
MSQEKSVALGAEGSLNIKLENGKLVIEVKHVHASGEVVLRAVENPDYFLDKLAAAIPGSFDDAVIAIAKSAIKSQ